MKSLTEKLRKETLFYKLTRENMFPLRWSCALLFSSQNNFFFGFVDLMKLFTVLNLSSTYWSLGLMSIALYFLLIFFVAMVMVLGGLSMSIALSVFSFFIHSRKIPKMNFLNEVFSVSHYLLLLSNKWLIIPSTM